MRLEHKLRILGCSRLGFTLLLLGILLIVSRAVARAEVSCAASFKASTVAIQALAIYPYADGAKRRDVWVTANRAANDSSEFFTSDTCDQASVLRGDVAYALWAVVSLGNGARQQSIDNLDLASAFLINSLRSSSNDFTLDKIKSLDDIDGFNVDVYRWYARRLVSMYKANHYAFGASNSLGAMDDIEKYRSLLEELLPGGLVP